MHKKTGTLGEGVLDVGEALLQRRVGRPITGLPCYRITGVGTVQQGMGGGQIRGRVVAHTHDAPRPLGRLCTCSKISVRHAHMRPSVRVVR